MSKSSASLAALIKSRSALINSGGGPPAFVHGEEPIPSSSVTPAPAAVTPPLTPTAASTSGKETSTKSTPPVKYTPKVATFSAAPKCLICEKTVYKMEEIVALGEHWHDKCFTCGGKNKDGCGKVLKRDGYVDHGGMPYCTPCYNKLFRPKGYGFGNTLNTDYGPSPPDVRDEPIFAKGASPVASAVSPSGGPPAPFSKPAPPAASRPAAPAPAPAPAPPLTPPGPAGHAPAAARTASPPPAPKHVPPPPPKHAPALVSMETIINRTETATAPPPPPAPPAPQAPSKPAAPVVAPAPPAPQAPSKPAAPVVAPAPPTAKSAPPVAPAAPAPKYTPTNDTTVHSDIAPKCTICGKTVYKVEEVVAVGRVWHDKCFTCGGNNSDGCGKVLSRHGYVDHANQPYCNACHKRNFGPKGFGYSNTLNSTGIVTSDLANVSIGETKPSPPPVLPVATSSKTVAIGASTRAVKDSTLYKEASYAGTNDEVDESEW